MMETLGWDALDALQKSYGPHEGLQAEISTREEPSSSEENPLNNKGQVPQMYRVESSVNLLPPLLNFDSSPLLQGR